MSESSRCMGVTMTSLEVDVPDYQVLLAWADDEMGIMFHEWWNTIGQKLYAKWYDDGNWYGEEEKK